MRPGIRISADTRADDCRRIPIKANVSGISAAPTATARRSTLLRPTVSAGFFDLPLDPDHGKDDHRAPHLRVRTIHGRPQPPRSRIRWKFNNGPHALTFSGGRSLTQFAATAVIKNKRG
jgi:hypothetical protein